MAKSERSCVSSMPHQPETIRPCMYVCMCAYACTSYLDPEQPVLEGLEAVGEHLGDEPVQLLHITYT